MKKLLLWVALVVLAAGCAHREAVKSVDGMETIKVSSPMRLGDGALHTEWTEVIRPAKK